MSFIVADASEYDVVVVGSGAGGLLAAIRAHDLGLRPIVIEKSDRYGGTSAVSGGAIWIPNNAFLGDQDSPAKALGYLEKVTEGRVPTAKLERYVQMAPEMVAYLKSLGIEYYTNPYMPYPDYYPFVKGSLPGGRTMLVRPMDGGALGEEFFRLRESYPEFKMFDKIALDLLDGGIILNRVKGWQKVVLRTLWRYWTDLPFRRRTHRDRLLTIGNALIGGLRKAMIDRGIPLALNTAMTGLETSGGNVVAVQASAQGRPVRIGAGRAVILASGGYEQSQQMRNENFPQATDPSWSATPRDNNVGDALTAVREIGAAVEFLDEAWWAPTVNIPYRHAPNIQRHQALFFERGYPHSLAVNRLGRRFTNEICSYHQFGKAMLRDNAETGANLPCWLIFDADYREKYPLGGLQPGWSLPDRKVPPDWFDTFLYKAETLAGLAAKIGLPVDTLAATVSRFNEYALKGEDPDFGRGQNVYNQFFGDPNHQPNRNLGPIAKAPFYAVRIDLGDLGSKGGPRTDEEARVLREDGTPISGLYAIGNCSGSVMGPAYPGAGATLGSAMTFAYAATANIARRNSVPEAAE
ncbi:FAD-binding protein [Rhizorhabdus dicambivorans]|uniref:FAD-binding protein n=1 Tax=Rhizorhabdus dicambivorans TaxID=1850238 RepID=A0A2A4FWZ3_9SPHN|nr:FAD-binding protein [Rhizorhabdus dicambivorans]ATE65855.1 FAD-binding protein [Rhizorhabdus dicambivorans]PCE42969.1 FAD-binding protein [Rhizorhabdus dicambivorans]